MPDTVPLTGRDLRTIERAREVDSANGESRPPVCTAPFSTLILDADGTVRVCPASPWPVLDEPGPDLLRVFHSTELAAIRAPMTRGELPRTHCSACVHRVQTDAVEHAPLVRDFGSRHPVPPGHGPSHLLLRLDRGEPRPAALPDQVASVLSGLEELEVEARDPLRHDAFAAIVERVRQLPEDERPRLALRLGLEPLEAERWRQVLGEVPVARIVLPAGAELEARLRAARELAGETGIVVVELVLTPDNWYELHGCGLACAAAGATLDVRATGRDGSTPVAAMTPAELRVLASLLGSSWHLFAESARPPSLAPDAYDQLRAELRKVAITRARATRPGDEEAGLLELPPPDHAWLREPGLGTVLVEGLLGLERSSGLERWAAARADGIEAAAAGRRPWVRLLLQRAATSLRSEPASRALLRLYADDAERSRLLEEERALAQGRVLERAVAGWHEWLGLEALGPRQRPFEIPPPRPPRPAEPVDVTVLVPSYRHETFVGECVRSVLAQTFGGFRLLVVDDASPDGTAGRARGFDDGRLEVRVNETNVGLGNSVLAALESVTTPFVALLNSDDAFHPERLQRCRQVLLDDPSAQLVATGLALVDAEGGEITPERASRLRDGVRVYDWVQWYHRAQPESAPDDAFAELLAHNFLATSTNLVCRTDFLRGRADALRSLKYCLDWDLFLEAAREGGLRYLPDALATYRLHAANTVWFREGRRWTYYLEVNRVVGRHLRRLIESVRHDDELAAVRRALDLAAGAMARNTEIDGTAALLNELLGGVELERHSESDPGAADRVRSLAARAEAMARLYYATRGLSRDTVQRWLGSLDRVPELETSRVLAELLQEEARDARVRTDALERGLNRLRAETRKLERRTATVKHLEAAYDDFVQHVRRLDREREELRQQRADLQAELARVREEFAAERQHLEELTRRQERERRQLDEAQAHVDAERERMRRRLRETQAQLDVAREEWQREVETLRASPEWRIGWLLWTKTPFFAKSRRLAKRTWRRVRDARERRRMRRELRRQLSRPDPSIKVVAGTTAMFPVISHTFVYQELLAFHKMAGWDVRLVHTQDGDPDGLHEAFRYLDQNRCQFSPSWDRHVADFLHYRERHPDRVESLLRALSEHSGIEPAQLERRFELMLAFTHARLAEEWGADYVHTYFFYDQALNGLVTSWVLDLPRGLSTYADHMMSDWPLKVVPLHLRTAEVIVATSRRIRDELIGIGGPEIAEKVIVKPNGVDGSRFPFVQRQEARDRPFELLCVSRIEPKKGMLELVDTAEVLARRGRPVRVGVVGGADKGTRGSHEYAKRFQQAIAARGLGDVVVLHGRKRQEEMRPLFARADAFVAAFVETESGDKDGIPTAILEAMSTGLPIVATDAGSIPEIVDDGAEGFVVPQRDPAALATAIERLADDPPLALRMGRAARDRFEREFDIHATEPRLHQRVRDAVARRRAQRT